MKLLLISNGLNHDQNYLEHALPWLKEHFMGVKRILFIPYALFDHDAYYKKVADALKDLNIEIISAHTSNNPVELLDQVDGIFIGGGSTFCLLDDMNKYNLTSAIANKVRNGMPYAGASAGINVVCPTIKTTNDMPIVDIGSLNAMSLVNFQINPHYKDPDKSSTHQGEPTEKRLLQFHERNSTPVVGLREGCALYVTDEKVELLGPHQARIFRKGENPIEIQPGTDLNDVLVQKEKKINHFFETGNYTPTTFVPKKEETVVNHSHSSVQTYNKITNNM